MAARNSTLTAARLRELLKYDPETGVFTRRVHTGPRTPAGSVAGGPPRAGKYSEIWIDGAQFFAHRLAWLYVHGSWPQNVIDHRDREPSNNRIANLRDVPQGVNVQNEAAKPHRHNAIGFRGVLIDRNPRRRSRMFKARITLHGKQHHLGYFATPEEAHAAYLRAKRKMHEGANC